MKASERFLDDEVTFSGKFSSNVMRTIRDSFRPFKMRIAVLLVLGILARFLLLGTANILGLWADSLCKGDSCRRGLGFSWVADFGPWDFMRLLVWFAVVGFILNTLFRVAISRTGARAVSILYDEVTMRTSRLPMSFFDSTPVGRIVSRFGSDYGAVFRMAGGPLGEFLCLMFDLILMLILTMAASLWFTPVVAGIIVLNYSLYRLNNPHLRAERRSLSMSRGPAIAHFAETVQGATTIKVYGHRESFLQRFNELLGKTMLHRMRTLVAVHSFGLQMTAATAFLLLITGVGGVWLVTKGFASVGAVGVAFTFIMMTSTTIQQFFEWLANLEEAMTGIERLDQYLRKPLEPGALVPSHSTFSCGQPLAPQSEDETAILALPKPKTGFHLAVANLTLRYRPDLPLVLQDLSFDVPEKQFFAVVGRTGSGKSSLIQALFLLYPKVAGSIAVGGLVPDLTGKRPLAPGTIGLAAYRQYFSLIPQEPVLFRATLRENLKINPSTSDAEIRAALREIGIAPWVEKLGTNQMAASARSNSAQGVSSRTGQGLDYVIEERGSNLSTGERQLLCMARAMLQGAPILIMDEATSAIDPQSEELLVRATEHVLSDRTRIVVAHRLSTIAACDRVLWLHQGRCRAIGEPEEVLPLFSKSGHAKKGSVNLSEIDTAVTSALDTFPVEPDA